jgi:4-diphosphocytidyl-2-C-methyl-D-erythritol kinase
VAEMHRTLDSGDGIYVKSRAKINLFLNITGTDPEDGYHYVDSLMQEVTLYDEITIKKSSSDSILFENAEIPAINTVSSSIKLLKEKFNIKDSFRIIVKKNIPSGAGLGGGSSNAAAVLSTLASIYKIDLLEIMNLGRLVGSDVPFFFTGGLCRIRGKGELVENSGIKLKGVIFIIVYPDIRISTAWAYEQIDHRKLTKLPEIDLKEVRGNGDIDFLKKIVYNKFQLIILKSCQELNTVKKELDGFLDSHLSFMSGSGSSLVFVYSDRGKARHDLAVLHKKYSFKAFLCRPFYRKTRQTARLFET